MKYLVAVSGGIDSVVLLHKLVKEGEHELFVAHFDHGIRDDSADDARFVEGLARQYNLEFVSRREILGKQASEALARNRRYAFLRAAADDKGAVIVTAHHADDVVETVAINIKRGTGWRGLAAFDSASIVRPQLHVSKADIREYALQERLEWVEDSTNSEDAYLRNRIRQKIARKLDTLTKRKIVGYRDYQVRLKHSIDEIVSAYRPETEGYSRYFFITLDESVAVEVLRSILMSEHGVSPMRLQIERALLVIKTARPGTKYDVSAGVVLRFTVRTFLV